MYLPTFFVSLLEDNHYTVVYIIFTYILYLSTCPHKYIVSIYGTQF